MTGTPVCGLCVPTTGAIICTGRCRTGVPSAFQTHPITPSLDPPIQSLEPQLLDLVAYRVWMIRDAYLTSTSMDTVWLPGAIIEGDVTTTGGVHAHKSLDRAIQHYLSLGNSALSSAFGTVRLWGSVVEHENGYRASYARLLSIFDVQINSPWSYERHCALKFFQAKYNYIEKESENDAIS